ncbi:TonB-dependent receptor [Phenylobacterium sp. LjRoot225]|uniref:TonB-dependent receptor n=1 Tax=Phenylobacterium sp. LjRoot225 TaxID=3342285 RepID=UPI003ECDCE86
MLASVALATGLSGRTSAHAAEGAASETAESATLAEVVVTAERRSTTLQDTPIALTAFSPQTLAERHIQNVRDLAGQAPNLSISRVTISHTTQTYSLRGVGESDPIQEPVLAVYVDDVYAPRQIGSMIEFNDLERIEVLRGPQGALYGRNSSAGALRIITRDPDRALRANAEIGLGNFGAIEARGLIEGPISDDLSGSLSFIHHSRDGITHDPTLGHDVNRIDVDAYRAKLRWTPNERLDALLTLNAVRDRSDSRSYIPVRQPGGGFRKNVSYSEVEPRQDLDQISGSARITYKLTDQLQLKSVSAYGGFDLNPVYYENDGEAALIQKNLIHYNDQYATQEIQLNGDFGRVAFSTGVFYLHERFFVQRDGYSRRSALATDPTTTPANYNFLRAHNITNTDAYAVFGEATWSLSDKLKLITGLRWTQETKSFTFDNAVLNLAGQVVAPSIKGKAHDTWVAITPKVVVQYEWSPELNSYLSYSKGFKSGGYDNRATRLDLAVLPFAPEEVITYEGGLKTRAFDQRLSANLAVFYNDYRDLQVSFYDPAYVGSRRGNAGQAHTWGVELETQAALTRRLSAQLAGGYLFAIYDSYKGAGGAGVNADGNRLPGAPRWTLSGAMTWDVPVELPGALQLNVNAQYQTVTYSSATPAAGGQNRVPAQGFLNAVAAWTAPNPRWSVVASARNLLDSQKPVSSTYTPSTSVYYLNYPDPRTVTLSLRYRL